MCKGIGSDGLQEYMRTPALLKHIQPAGLAIVAAFDAQAVPVDQSSWAVHSLPMRIPSQLLQPDEKDYHHNHSCTLTGSKLRRSKKESAQKSIFSTGALSPPGYNFLHRPPSPDFLDACFSCRRSLGPGKDIYMYRGDRAFCSTECRYKQIVADESPSSTLPVIDQRPPPSSSSINRLAFTPAMATITVLG